MSKRLLSDGTPTPFSIDFENRAVGHTITIGSAGAGMSALNNFLLVQMAHPLEQVNQADSLYVLPDGEGDE